MTLNELRAALDAIVAADPKAGELPAMLDDVDYGHCEVTNVRTYAPGDPTPHTLGGSARAVVLAARENHGDPTRGR